MDRKEQILDVAAEMVQTKSFSAFSYKDLSERLGIRKASIHHHFPTKEDLAVKLVQRYTETLKGIFAQIDEATDDPWKKLEMQMGGMCSLAAEKKICATGSLEADFGSIPESVQHELKALNRVMSEWITGVLQDGLDQGVMAFPGTAKSQAGVLRAVMQGGLQMARAEGVNLEEPA